MGPGHDSNVHLRLRNGARPIELPAPWSSRDSNPEPSDCQPDAQPIELQPQVPRVSRIRDGTRQNSLQFYHAKTTRGEEGTRTLNTRYATPVLYQLSYNPRCQPAYRNRTVALGAQPWALADLAISSNCVGIRGFEPLLACSQSRCLNQVWPYPGCTLAEKKSVTVVARQAPPPGWRGSKESNFEVTVAYRTGQGA